MDNRTLKNIFEVLKKQIVEFNSTTENLYKKDDKIISKDLKTLSKNLLDYMQLKNQIQYNLKTIDYEINKIIYRVNDKINYSLTRSPWSFEMDEEFLNTFDFGDSQNIPVKTKSIKIADNIAYACKSEVKEIIFNSYVETDLWSVENNKFSKIVNGKTNICVVIEDERDIIIGGYIPHNITDKNQIIFYFDANDIFNGDIYNLKKDKNHFYLGNETDEILFGFGWNEEGDKKICHDICVYKNGVDKPSTCKQDSYDYRDIQSAVTSDGIIKIKQIKVYQMSEPYQRKYEVFPLK